MAFTEFGPIQGFNNNKYPPDRDWIVNCTNCNKTTLILKLVQCIDQRNCRYGICDNCKCKHMLDCIAIEPEGLHTIELSKGRVFVVKYSPLNLLLGRSVESEASAKKCNCPTIELTRVGCQCGGI